MALPNRLKNCLRCDAPVTGRGGFKKLCDDCARDWRWCPRCETLRAQDEFGQRKGGYCRECHGAYNTARYDPEYHAAYHLSRKFGISMDEAYRLRAIDECEVCGSPPAPGDRLHVDHDHATGEIRGVLCRWCNYAVAVVEDPRLESIHAYLRRKRLRLVEGGG